MDSFNRKILDLAFDLRADDETRIFTNSIQVEQRWCPAGRNIALTHSRSRSYSYAPSRLKNLTKTICFFLFHCQNQHPATGITFPDAVLHTTEKNTNLPLLRQLFWAPALCLVLCNTTPSDWFFLLLGSPEHHPPGQQRALFWRLVEHTPERMLIAPISSGLPKSGNNARSLPNTIQKAKQPQHWSRRVSTDNHYCKWFLFMTPRCRNNIISPNGAVTNQKCLAVFCWAIFFSSFLSLYLQQPLLGEVTPHRRENRDTLASYPNDA